MTPVFLTKWTTAQTIALNKLETKRKLFTIIAKKKYYWRNNREFIKLYFTNPRSYKVFFYSKYLSFLICNSFLNIHVKTSDNSKTLLIGVMIITKIILRIVNIIFGGKIIHIQHWLFYLFRLRRLFIDRVSI